jgi:TDG/mug DNA glycosylase family protein
VTKLRKGEEKPGIERLRREIDTYHPPVVCFIGKITYNVFRGSRDCNYGWHESIDGSRVYVMHFPIPGPASVRIQGLQELKVACQNA